MQRFLGGSTLLICFLAVLARAAADEPVAAPRTAWVTGNPAVSRRGETVEKVFVIAALCGVILAVLIALGALVVKRPVQLLFSLVALVALATALTGLVVIIN